MDRHALKTKYGVFHMCTGIFITLFSISAIAQNQLKPLVQEEFIYPHANPLGMQSKIVLMDRVVKLKDKFYFVYPYGKVVPETGDFVKQTCTLFEYEPKENITRPVYQSYKGIYNLSATTDLLLFTDVSYDGFHAFSPENRKLNTRSIQADNYKLDNVNNRHTVIYTFPGSKDALALSFKRGSFYEGEWLYDFSAMHLENDYCIEIMKYPNVNLKTATYLPFIFFKPYLFPTFFFTIGNNVSPNSKKQFKSVYGFPLYNINIKENMINMPKKSLDYRQMESKQREVFSSVYNISGNPAVFLKRPVENTEKQLIEVAIFQYDSIMVYNTKLMISKNENTIGIAVNDGITYLIHKDFLGYLDTSKKKFSALTIPGITPDIINNGSMLFTDKFLFYSKGDDIFYTSKYDENKDLPKKITVNTINQFPDMITALTTPAKAVTTNKYLFYITTANQVMVFNPVNGKQTEIELPLNTKVTEFRMFYAADDHIFVGGIVDTGSGSKKYGIWTISDHDISE